MNDLKNKLKKYYSKKWVWVIAILFLLYIRLKANNVVALIILVIGLLCIVFGAWQLWKRYKSDEKKPTNPLIIVMVLGLLFSVFGYCTLDVFQISSEKEKLVKTEFYGIDENSSPLSASNLKLLKKGYTYTVIGDFKKESTKPTESYFDYDIILIDKHGKYIKTEKVTTIPTPENGNILFKSGGSKHFEKEIFVFEDNKPVKVEFANIKEYSKEEFINNTIKKAEEEIKSNNLSNAQKYIELALKYTPTTDELKSLLEKTQQGIIEPSQHPTEEIYIIGSNKDTVRKIFTGYKEKSSIFGENAIDFDSENLLVTVFFNNDKAEGVIFLSNNLNDMNTLTGEGSYVSQHYDELLKMATSDTNIKVESDLTKFNSQGNKKVASELYIGNTPYAETNNSNISASSGTTQSNTKSTKNKEESEFSYCLESGVVAGVKIYLKPNNESYVGTITAFSDEIYNEKGKKEKGVYLSGGSNDGWYKRSEIKKCYVRKDDPNLPSTRLID